MDILFSKVKSNPFKKTKLKSRNRNNQGRFMFRHQKGKSLITDNKILKDVMILTIKKDYMIQQKS